MTQSPLPGTLILSIPQLSAANPLGLETFPPEILTRALTQSSQTNGSDAIAQFTDGATGVRWRPLQAGQVHSCKCLLLVLVIQSELICIL